MEKNKREKLMKNIISALLCFSVICGVTPLAGYITPNAKAETSGICENTVDYLSVTQPPEESYEFNGNFYKIINDEVTWDEAKANCESLGGHLVTITSVQEQDFINSINFYGESLWIGTFRDDTYRWQWVTGEEWDYTNWGEGEPNDSSNVVPNENCAAVWPDLWNDLNSENTMEQSGYICEWEWIGAVEIRKPSITEISYGDSIIIYADVEVLPMGWTVRWTADNGNFTYSASADGKICVISPLSSGDTTFTATVYDANGKEICKDEQTMTSKAGFFQKIIAFFKKLFGMNRIIVQ